MKALQESVGTVFTSAHGISTGGSSCRNQVIAVYGLFDVGDSSADSGCGIFGSYVHGCGLGTSADLA
jgi:hypothetical protein